MKIEFLVKYYNINWLFRIIIIYLFCLLDPVLKEAAINAAGPQPGLNPPGLNSGVPASTPGATPSG